MSLNLSSTVTLNNGIKIPIVGLGTWRSEPGQVAIAVKAALLNGYKHIDTAWVYGNEKEVGDGIKAAIEESKGALERKDIFVTTKLWNQFHKAEEIEPAIRESLKLLQLDYVDLYLVHWPVAAKFYAGNILSELPDGTFDLIDVPLKETWLAVEKLVGLGLTKAIGISNFTVAQTEEILSYATIKPVTNQCEAHPHFQNSEMLEFCKTHDMVFTAYSSLGTVFEGQSSCLTDPVVKSIAEKLGKSTAQVLLRWALQKGMVILPKSVSVSRVIDNSKLFDFEISADDMKALDSIEQGRKLNPSWGPWTKS